MGYGLAGRQGGGGVVVCLGRVWSTYRGSVGWGGGGGGYY